MGQPLYGYGWNGNDFMKRVELLAPCGNYEGFLAAVNAGADAVYLGGRQFGARAYADNFSEEELVKVIRQAHLFGVKVYLTVNTLIKERELSELYQYLRPFYEAGLDGAIVQDMGVFQLLKRSFPGLLLHASTQMTITGVYGAKYLKEQGCSRVVPARELSLKEIKRMKEEADIEVEAFIHGAMCYSYSGQCLMSSMIGGRSGNRGRCAQPCRLPYKVAGKEGFFLSLKDMNTIEHIPELIEAGIDSFKIEGRMKRPEYVAGTVSVYRKYIDCYYKNKDFCIAPEDRKLLSRLYIRSETGNGYYDQEKGRDMLTLKKPGYNEADTALLKQLNEKYIRDLPRIPVNMRVCCKTGEPLFGEVRLCLPDVNRGPAKEICCSLTGPVVEKADNRVTNREEIREQLRKTGGTPFIVSECQVESEGDPFVPVKWLKELRRGLLQEIYAVCGERTRGEKEDGEKEDGEKEYDENVSDTGKESPVERRQKVDNICYLTSFVQTKEQFFALFEAFSINKSISVAEKRKEGFFECLIVDADLFSEEESVRERLFGSGICWGIRCPVIIREKDEAWLKRLQELIAEGKPEYIYCASIDAYFWAESIPYRGRLAGEASLYAWNSKACRFWGKTLDRITISPELSSREIRELCGACILREDGQELLNKLEISVYGRTPLMVTANCVKLSSERCDKNRNRYAELTDRFQNVFPVYTNCSHCYNMIYNCLPASCYDSMWMLRQDGIRNFRTEFTVEDAEETVRVYKTFKGLLTSEIKKTEKTTNMRTTSGRLRKGVE